MNFYFVPYALCMVALLIHENRAMQDNLNPQMKISFFLSGVIQIIASILHFMAFCW